jgi:hypothetical protein
MPVKQDVINFSGNKSKSGRLHMLNSEMATVEGENYNEMCWVSWFL